jgi:5-amino-6-(5-phosphoribosylamino)uracil reductase
MLASNFVASSPEDEPRETPLMALCLAASINGKIYHPDGLPLGTERDRFQLEWLRAQADALFFGANIVRIERRQLEFRYAQLGKLTATGQVPPLIIVCRNLNFDFTNRFWDTPTRKIILYLGSDEPQNPLQNIELHSFSPGTSLSELVKYLKTLGFQRILCEGGGKLVSALVREQLVDEMFLTLTPWLIDSTKVASITEGDAPPARLNLISTESFGNEVLLRYRFPGGKPWSCFEKPAANS